MNNYAVARVFTRIADLMEIQGENVFKIRAYRTAASTMQELTESLEVLAERGELKEVPGIGEAIAQKTRDILATGTTKLYEQLRAEVPETLVELLNLPGFGAKKIQTVWRELGVRTLDDLERAAREQRVRSLPGMAAKTEEKLIAAIEAHRRRRERRPIGEALPYAEGLLRLFRETEGLQRLELAGSIRRMQDTVGDIDYVGAAEDPARVLDRLAEHPEVEHVEKRADDALCVMSRNGVRLDFHLVPPDRFLAALQQFTGSAEHNRQLAAMSLTVTPGSVPAEPRQSDLLDDSRIYRDLGLPPIPPELREGRGEIEAAREGRLPRLITVADYRGCLHAHSTWSDGSAPIARMAQAAHELGYAYHANTDHSQALSVARGLDENRLAEQSAEIDGVNATFTDGFRVLKGIECDILADGTLDLPLDVLDHLDVVVASVHMHQKQDEETMTQRILRALESGVVDILAHPTGRILGMRDPYAVDLEKVMDAALANGVALEINAFPDRLDLNEIYARRACEKGIPISINPDAHRPEHLSLLRYGISQARRAWLEPENVINTWELDRLTRWLRVRR